MKYNVDNKYIMNLQVIFTLQSSNSVRWVTIYLHFKAES